MSSVPPLIFLGVTIFLNATYGESFSFTFWANTSSVSETNQPGSRLNHAARVSEIVSMKILIYPPPLCLLYIFQGE